MNLRIAVALALIASSPAYAGGNPDRVKLDTNGDGSIDLAEIQARKPDFTVEKFNAADANGDGLLSRDEWRGAYHRDHDRPKLDADGDGSYSLEEMQKAHPDLTQERYTSFDGDKDGKLTRDELKSGFGREMFSRLDKDASGGVSLEEMQSIRSSVTQEKFTQMDADGNGQLSQDELRSAHKKRRHHDGAKPETPAPEQPSGS